LAFASLLLAAAARSAAPDLAKAEELLQAGQAAEALVLFEQALEADPSSVGAHLGLGRAYYALGQYARARIEFETVLRTTRLDGNGGRSITPRPASATTGKTRPARRPFSVVPAITTPSCPSASAAAGIGP
jgi:tetratricopeptide (TPR) repeat protein